MRIDPIKVLSGPLAALALALSCAVAGAAPLELDPSPDAPARAVVDAVFRDYVAGKVGAEVQTAVIDADGDGTGEVVARFVHSSSCLSGSAQCRTVVLRHEAGNWRIVLDRPTDALTFGAAPTGPLHALAPLDVDGTAWEWANGTYRPAAGAMGESVALEPVPAETVPSIAVAFGAGAVKLAAAGQATFEYARPALSEGDQFLAVVMRGTSACGVVAGCPVRILRRDGESWRPVLEASTTGAVAVGRAERDGVRDVAVASREGFVTLGWTGSAYSVADRVEAVAR